MANKDYLTLQDEIFLSGTLFDFNSQFEDYELKDDGYYAMYKEKEFGPFPTEICFLSSIVVNQDKLFRKYYENCGQDKTTDYFDTVLEVHGVDLKENYEAQHDGKYIFEEFKSVKNS